MSVRFRRRVSLFPGIRLNVGKRGVSLSTGPRGSSLTLGKTGLFANAGLPGSGLSLRKRVSGGASTSRSQASHPTGSSTTQISIHLNEDGSIDFLDSNDQPLPEKQVRNITRQKGEEIRRFLAEQCTQTNARIEALETIHLDTPPPDRVPVYTPVQYNHPEPMPPDMASIGVLGKLFKWIRADIENKNAEAQTAYEEQRQAWATRKSLHDAEEYRKKDLFEKRLYSDQYAMDELLEIELKSIEWPRETNVAFEVNDAGDLVQVDVDLPEIEDIPSKTASLPSRGWKIALKDLTESKLRKLYMNHVHGIGFRLIGEIFATLPTVNAVSLAAYSQRANITTGKIEDEYLYAIRVARDRWSSIDFQNLRNIDVISALEQFDLQRKMTKTGIFTRIHPQDSEKLGT